MVPLDRFLQEIQDQKVLIWGLGLNGGGLGVTRFFAEHGAQVRVTDMKTADQLTDTLTQLQDLKGVDYVLGEHKESDFLWADLIIRNPAIPPTAPLLKFCQDNGKQVTMEPALFLKYCPGKTIGITGTRGKSTTTAMITKLLQDAGLSVYTGGNNKISLLQQLEQITAEDYVVMELSSFQTSSLPSVQVSPQISVITNMYADHLNWHVDMDDYIEAKKNLVRYQTKDDIKILNKDNEIVATRFPDGGDAPTTWFGEDTDNTVQIKEDGVYVSGERVVDADAAQVAGKHNLYNMAAAVAVGIKLNIPLRRIGESLQSFNGLPYRQQLVAEINGVKFINDSTSTMPEALITCLKSFDGTGRIHLIAGGVDKNLGFHEVVTILTQIPTSIHAFEGSWYDKLIETNDRKLTADNEHALHQKIHGPFASMKAAIDSAVTMAQSGDYIILSPGAASFNLFKNEWDRAEQFDQIVERLRDDK